VQHQLPVAEEHPLGQARRSRGVERCRPRALIEIRRYRDFGSLVNLSEYGSFGHLLDSSTGRAVKIAGLFARAMYKALYRMHLASVHGPMKAGMGVVVKASRHRKVECMLAIVAA